MKKNSLNLLNETNKTKETINRKVNEEMKTGTVSRVNNQIIYERCHKVELAMENVKIFVDEAMIRAFCSMDATDENIDLITEEICIKATPVYAEYMELKKSGHYQQPHVAIISLHLDGNHECSILSFKEDESSNVIKQFDENCEATEYFPPKSLFNRYLPEWVNIDGVKLVEYGMYNVPDVLNQLDLYESTVAAIIKMYNLSISVEEAMNLMSQPVYHVPLGEEVIQWVRMKTIEYIDMQPDTEVGRNNIEVANERYRKFVDTFKRKYDEGRFSAAVLDYYRYLEEEPDGVKSVYYTSRIKCAAASLLMVILDMTEFDFAYCFWKS